MGLEKALSLKDGEQVLYLTHQFPLAYWHWMVAVFLLLVAPFFFLFPLFDAGLVGVLVFCFLIVFGLVLGLRQMMKWYYNVFVVTGERIIDIYQKGIFDRTVSPVPFRDIQGVAFRKKGLWQTIFDFGTVIIEISQGKTKIEVRKVRHPHLLEQLVDELRIHAAEKDQAEVDEKSCIIKEFADKLSIDDVKRLVEKLKQDERDRVISDLYSGKDLD